MLKRAGNMIKRSTVTPYAVLFCIFMLFFSGVSVEFGDDMAFRSMLNGVSPLQAALDYRQAWSARIVIETVLLYLYSWPPVVWRVINSAMVVLLAYAFARMAGADCDRRLNWLACGFVCLYPFTEMVSAGWMTTTCNYLWPVALGLYALTPWMDTLMGEKPKAVHCVLALLALVYAANAEQMLAIAMGVTLVGYAGLVLQHRRPGVFHIVWVVVVVGMAVQTLMAPGPALRIVEEAARLYPDFETVSPIKRIYDVFMDMSWYIFIRVLPVFIAALVVALSVFQRTKKLVWRALSLVPLGFSLALGPLYSVTTSLFPSLYVLRDKSFEYDFFSAVSSAVPFLLYLAVWVIFLVSIYRAGEDKAQARTLSIIFVAGLCSQLIMFMAPSAVVSYQRYTVYLQMGMLLVAYILMCSLEELENRCAYKLGAGAVAAFSVGNIVNLFLAR